MTTTTAARRRTPLWAKILLILFVLFLIGAAGFGGMIVGKFLGASEERDVQVIRSITREEQIILVTAGVGDIKEENSDGLKVAIPGLEALAFDVPGTDRSILVRYDFDAKLGIEGKDVKIEHLGEKSYRISIPEFIYLGNDDPKISIASEKNGLLSWTTPEIDKLALAEAVLDDETVVKTIEGSRPVLEEQARIFYTNIITAIDPDITLDFVYAD
ncbi:hypothetical protein [uncultured Microbacterium sp.]|uniref:hypothetical protein n=1 Tax=uncultured Microbacterium sp. TaxID=191216 RepID=UPI0026087544|nr:hypothetical protein [uncultured Microbacterium sp.]